MSGIGGYVRRCERVTADKSTVGHLRDDAWLRHVVLPSGAVVTWRHEPPAFQSMPMLRFEPFNVTEPVDTPGMKGLRSHHGH